MQDIIKDSWKIIAPFWPLQNLIATNPLKGLEDLPFEEALAIGESYFRAKEIPDSMESINRETIKWMQVFVDEGQATISMPMRKEGFYKSWKNLAVFDTRLCAADHSKLEFISNLAESPKEMVYKCLELLKIKQEDQVEFLTLLLTTLPGWASYVKYLTDWTTSDENNKYQISQEDYMAVRIIITYLLCPEAKDLLKWHKSLKKNSHFMEEIEAREKDFRLPLLKKLAYQILPNSNKAIAQLVFCIDVRSEPFRRALEKIGNYETFGFAGFLDCL